MVRSKKGRKLELLNVVFKLMNSMKRVSASLWVKNLKYLLWKKCLTKPFRLSISRAVLKSVFVISSQQRWLNPTYYGYNLN